jgi:hypothetical protein
MIYDSLYNFMSLKNRLSTVEVKFKLLRKNYTTLQPILKPTSEKQRL